MNIFNKYGHLTNESISIYIDALLGTTNKQIPMEIFNHVADCKHCRKMIISIYEEVRKAEDPIRAKEKWYENILKNKVKIIPISWERDFKKKQPLIINF